MSPLRFVLSLIFAITAATTVVAQHYTGTYAWTDGGQNTTANWSLYVPENVTDADLRSIVIWSNGSGEDRRHMTRVSWVQNFARAHQAAILAYTPDAAVSGNAAATQANLANLLSAAATASGRASLVNAPLLPLGMSFGGINSSVFAAQLPDRVLGFAANKGIFPLTSINSAQTGPTGVALVPGLVLPGEDDANSVANAIAVQSHFLAWRGLQSNTGRLAYALDYNSGHNSDTGLSWDLATVFLSEAQRLRHPATPLSTTPGTRPALATIPFANGWLAERAVVSGAVASVGITDPGSGYTSTPTVTFSGGGGSGATATATRVSGFIIELVLTSGGSGYTSPPTITISGGGGSGATATAILGAGGSAAPVAARPTFPALAPVASYAGSPAAASTTWLPSERAALAYRAFTSTDATDINRTEAPRANALQIETPARFQQFISGENVVVTVDPRDWSGVASMTLLLDGTPVSTLSAAPWRWTLNAPAAGHHSVVVEATDAQGNQRATFVTFSVLDLPAATRTWTGGAGSSAIGNAANWGGLAIPADRRFGLLALNGSTANNQFNLSNGSETADPHFLGVTFASAPGANGFTLSGWRKLFLGHAGIRNLDDSTQSLTLAAGGERIRLLSSQTWAALSGDLAVTSPVFLGTTDADTLARNSVLTLHAATGRTITLDGILSGDGALIKDGPGLALLNAANTFADGKYGWDPALHETVRVHAGNLRLGSAGSLDTAARLFIADEPTATFDLNNRAVTVANLQGAGTLALGPTGSLAIASQFREAAQHSLAGSHFRGTITGGTSGSTALSHTAATSWINTDGGAVPASVNHELTLAGASTFSGRVVLNSGHLRVAHASALGASGTGNDTSLAAASVLTLAPPAAPGFTLDEDFSATTSATIHVPAADRAATLAGHISERTATTTLTKTGPGALVLARPAGNTLSGAVTVSAGSLHVANTSGSATGSGAVTVQSGATLGGTGAISGNVTLQSGARLAFALAASAASHDRLDVGGTLALNNTPLNLTVLGASPASGRYILAQAASITGAPGAVTALPGYTVSAGVASNQLYVDLQLPLTAQEQWRVTWFGTHENTGPGADLADTDGDGATNAAEYAAATDPLLPGAPVTAAAADLPARLHTLAPVADGHVRSNAPTTAYPSVDLLVNGAANAREAYLRYDLAALSGTVERAQLVFWPRANLADTATYVVEQITDAGDAWTESALTWNTRPASLPATAVTFAGPLSNGVPRVLDVTAMVADTLAADPAKKLGLRLYTAASLTADATFGETNSGTLRRPYLHITLRSSAATPVRILHAGDSITRGASGGLYSNTFNNGGWRYYLQNLLLAQGVDFRAVGPRTTDGSISAFESSTNQPAELDRPLLYQANAGFSGENIAYLRTNIASWLAASSADLVTLMIGTNDVGYSSTGAIPQGTLDTAKTNYTTLLNNLFTARPSAKVVMATIPPLGGSFAANNALRVEPFNTQVVRAVFAQFSASHPGQVYLVDNYAALSPSDISADGVHPGSLGHQKLARSWHAGITAALGRAEEVRFANQDAAGAAALRGGANAATAFGAATTPLLPAWTNTLLRARADTSSDARAKSLLKFDLADLPEKIGSATLAFAYHGASPSGLYDTTNDVVLHLYGIHDGADAWSASSVTWNTAPGHDPAGNGVLSASTTYLASVRVPAGSRTGDLVVFRSDALREFLTWRAGLDQLASFVVVASSRSAAEAVLHGNGRPEYQPPFLLVTPNPETTYADWSAARFSAPADRAPAADPDADGLQNLLEYALASDPTRSESASLPSVQVSGLSPQPSNLTLTFRRARADLTYEVLASSTLAPDAWQVIATNPGQIDETVTVTDTVALSAATRRFLRLRVAITSPSLP